MITVTEFNEKFKVGNGVSIYLKEGTCLNSIVRWPAEILEGKNIPVIWIHGIYNCIQLSSIEKIEPFTYEQKDHVPIPG